MAAINARPDPARWRRHRLPSAAERCGDFGTGRSGKFKGGIRNGVTADVGIRNRNFLTFSVLDIHSLRIQVFVDDQIYASDELFYRTRFRREPYTIEVAFLRTFDLVERAYFAKVESSRQRAQ